MSATVPGAQSVAPLNPVEESFLRQNQPPQDPFLPSKPYPTTPVYLDTQACLCRLQPNPGDDNQVAWRCVGNHTQDSLPGPPPRIGKWFAPTDAFATPSSNVTNGSNPVRRGAPAQFLPRNSDVLRDLAGNGSTQGLSIYDQACTGRNQTTYTTAFYQALAAQVNNRIPPYYALPCLRPGALPLSIKNASTWLDSGCPQGFFCPNNTVNSPPGYCPPLLDCQDVRLGGETCSQNYINIPMGPFEPVLCSSGYYCPPGGLKQIQCPSGSFCPPGATAPISCGAGNLCKVGAKQPVNILAFILVLIFDLILIGVCLYLKYRNRISDVSKRHDLGGKILGRSVGYKSLDDDQEMAELNPFALKRAATGFAAAIDRYEGGKIPKKGLKYDASPELVSFVDSMRKAIQGTTFGLAFGYDGLGFHPRKAAKPILQNITGHIAPGTVTAVMGGSGAGKSTFVNVLMGKQSHSGTVSVNGQTDKLKKYKKIIGYVPQDDIVLAELTVRENILHSARIRLPHDWKERDIENHVDAVVDCLELSHVKDSLVGSVAKPVISGGQRKRVSIGMELAAAPMALFLDEPTSGLDATSAVSLTKTLKAVSRLGITVIEIIHQPRMEIFEMIDDLILLGDGQLIYQGAESEVRSYFERLGFDFPPHANIGDVVTDIITGSGREYKPQGSVSKESLIERWRQLSDSGWAPENRSASRVSSRAGSIQESATLSISVRKRGASWPTQFYYNLARAFLQQYRMLSSFWFEMGVSVVGGFLIGLAQNSKKGNLFTGLYLGDYAILSSASDYKTVPETALLVAVAIGLIASAPGVKVFGEELLMYRRESQSGHSRSAYYMAKMISVLPRLAYGCLHFTVVFILLATPIMTWAASFAINLLYFYAIYGLASCITMLTRREDGPLLAVMASLIVAVMSGAAPPLSKVKSWHVTFIWYLSPGTWLAEFYFSQNILPLAYLYQVDIAEQIAGFTLNRYALDAALVLVIGTVYRVLAFGGLLFRGRTQVG